MLLENSQRAIWCISNNKQMGLVAGGGGVPLGDLLKPSLMVHTDGRDAGIEYLLYSFLVHLARHAWLIKVWPLCGPPAPSCYWISALRCSMCCLRS